MKHSNFVVLFFPITFFGCFAVMGQSAMETVKHRTAADLSWKDTDGHFINAHGAGIMEYNNRYYLFGEIKKGRTWMVPGQDWEDYRVPAGGISCYSSNDLVNWKYEGIVLAAVTGDSSNDLDTGRVIERPKVIYNETTHKFVMWMHIDKNDYSYARAGVAVSDAPAGPYTYLGSLRPNGQMLRDMTVFKDDDKKAYLIYSSENNLTMQVCLLSPDYLSPTPTYTRILQNQKREAPALFKWKKKYYLVTSYCSGWSPNADNMLGNWEQIGNPCTGPGSATTFQSQGTYILPLKDNTGNWLFMADRWNKTDLPNSGYIWLPLFIRNGRLEIKGPS